MIEDRFLVVPSDWHPVINSKQSGSDYKYSICCNLASSLQRVQNDLVIHAYEKRITAYKLPNEPEKSSAPLPIKHGDKILIFSSSFENVEVEAVASDAEAQFIISQYAWYYCYKIWFRSWQAYDLSTPFSNQQPVEAS